MKYIASREFFIEDNINSAWTTFYNPHASHDEMKKKFHEKFHAKFIYRNSKWTHLEFDSEEDFVLFMLEWG